MTHQNNMEQKKITIFYSWQSDLDPNTNLKAIRGELRSSQTKLETEIDNIRIVLDEATRNAPGSPDITNTLLEKISNSDIFICDLTSINNTEVKPESFRIVPNPNVLIELGFAISNLGWSRIIILFNKNYGDISQDIPFDIDRRRISTFQIKNKTDANGKGQLRTTLQEAIKLIIEKNPIKGWRPKIETSDEIKRKRDIENLNWLLTQIHIPTFNIFLESNPEHLRFSIMETFYSFQGVYKNNLCSFYDIKLQSLFDSLHEFWDFALSFGDYYHATANPEVYKFGDWDNYDLAELQHKILKELGENADKLENAMNELLNYIKINYIEIDINETIKIAENIYK